MSSSTDVLAAGNTAWRDYITDGVASSGENKATKPEIRAFVATVSAAVAGLDGAIVDLAAALLAAGAIVVEASADLPAGTDAAVGLVLTGTDAGLWARPAGGAWAATGLTMAGSVTAQVAANMAAIAAEEAARIAAFAALGDLAALDTLPLDKIAAIGDRTILGRGGPGGGEGQVYALTAEEVLSVAGAASAEDLGAEEAARIAGDNAEAAARAAAVGAEAAARAEAIAAEAARARAAERDILGSQHGRPGDGLASTLRIGQAADALGALVPDDWRVDDSVLGRCVEISAPRIPAGTGYLDLAPVERQALEPGRIYRATWALRQTVDPIDPAGDTVTRAIQWLGADKSALSITPVLSDSPAVGSAPSIVTRVIAGAAGDGIDVVWPAGARYAVPYIRRYWTTGTTRIAVLRIVDITDAYNAGVAGDLGDLTELVAQAQAQADAALVAANEAAEAAADLTTWSSSLEAGAQNLNFATDIVTSSLPADCISGNRLIRVQFYDSNRITGSDGFWRRATTQSSGAGRIQNTNSSVWFECVGYSRGNAKAHFGLQGNSSIIEDSKFNALVSWANETYGRTVYFPRGNYVYSTDKRFLQSWTNVCGDGFSSRLWAVSNAKIYFGLATLVWNSTAGRYNKSGTKVENCSVFNVALQPDDLHDGEILVLDFADDSRVHHCSFGSFAGASTKFEIAIRCRWTQWTYIHDNLIYVNGYCIQFDLEPTTTQNEDHFHVYNNRIYVAKIAKPSSIPAGICFNRKIINGTISNYTIFNVTIRDNHIAQSGATGVSARGIYYINEAASGDLRLAQKLVTDSNFFEHIPYPFDFMTGSSGGNDTTHVVSRNNSFLTCTTCYRGRELSKTYVIDDGCAYVQVGAIYENIRPIVQNIALSSGVGSVMTGANADLSYGQYSLPGFNGLSTRAREYIVQIPDGAQYVDVTHGLSAAPNMFSVASDWPGGSLYVAQWLTTSTTFRVYLTAVNTTGNPRIVYVRAGIANR